MTTLTAAQTTPALAGTTGFAVSDADGRTVGRVEGPMYGRSPDHPDALAVRNGGVVRRHHYVVPATSISRIDSTCSRIELSVSIAGLVRFL